MLTSRSGPTAVHVLLVLTCALSGTARAQNSAVTRWVIEPATSLAWWQVNPHFSHLWGTTCPREPSWQAGEGRDQEYYVNYANRPTTYDAGHRDARIPLYPRKTVRPLCGAALSGEISSDTLTWSAAGGPVTIAAEALVTGNDVRDAFTRRSILQTSKYPNIRFTLEKLEGVQPGDTIRATAIGTFEFRGVQTPVSAPVVAWREARGLRVQARFQLDPDDLVQVYGISRFALGLGIGMKLWKEMHVGIDAILRPATTGDAPRSTP
jgi:hypothetical protein